MVLSMNKFYGLCAIIAMSAVGPSEAFTAVRSESSPSSTALFSESSRRAWLSSIAASAVMVGSYSQPAHASYSAYANREKDWEDRKASGDIKYSSARSLRTQLQEIAPQNSEGRSKIFCPNGATSVVSPLMENKCSDVLMAIPSVYGRSEDITGNSIPGFKGGFYESGISSSSGVNAYGGFPQYSGTPKK